MPAVAASLRPPRNAALGPMHPELAEELGWRQRWLGLHRHPEGPHPAGPPHGSPRGTRGRFFQRRAPVGENLPGLGPRAGRSEPSSSAATVWLSASSWRLGRSWSRVAGNVWQVRRGLP